MDEWLDEVLLVLLDMLEKGEEIPDALFAEIADAIEEITAAELEARPIEAAQIPQLPKAPYPSSNINSFKYDPENEQLYVKFHGKDSADSGPIYSYEGVPEYIFDVFRRGAIGPKTSGSNKYHTWHKGITPSLGAAMYALIKEGPYHYQKVA
jgi:hypothetical protein